MFKRKKTLLVIAFLALAGVLSIFINSEPVRAVPDGTLYFTPATSSVAVNTDFTLDARIDPGTNAVNIVEIHVKYDPTKFRLDSITPNSSVFQDDNIANVIDNTNGVAVLTVGVGLSSALDGSGNLVYTVNPSVTADTSVGVFAFHSLTTAIDSPITLTDQSQAAADEESENVLLIINSAQVDVTDPADATAPVLTEVTPVPTPSRNATPEYTFNSTEEVSLTYAGDCSSSTAIVSSGDSTVTFNAIAEGTHSNCTITGTDASGNPSAALAVTSFTLDLTAPETTISVSPDALTTSTSASFEFTSNEAGTIECSLDSGAYATCTSPANYTSLADGEHVFSVRGVDAVGNTDETPATYTWTVDTTAPTLSETGAINVTNDTTPDYTFSSDEAGLITYGGSCSSSTTNAVSGDNTITFATLAEGAYSDCTITVTDAISNVSTPLAVSAFTVDTTPPTLAEVTPVTAETTDSTPDYTFSSTEAGTISYGGSCSSSDTSAISGNNTVTFNSLTTGTYSNCTITVTDAGGNASTALSVSSFEVLDVTPPVLSGGSPSGSLAAGTTSATLELSTNENATCKYSTSSGEEYDVMNGTFSSTGNQSHSTQVSGLSNGNSYNYYIRCEDVAGNSNTNDYAISFSVNEAQAIAEEEYDGEDEMDVPTPDIEYDNDEEELDSYFKDDKKIKFSEKIPELAGGKVQIREGSKVLKEEKIEDDGKWSLKVKFDETTTIKIKYFNKSGTEVASKKYKIRIDDEDPEFTDLPRVLTKKRGEKLWWTAIDNKDVSHYKYIINGEKTKTKDNFFHIPQDLRPGPHWIQVRAYDEAGNKEKKHVLVWVK